MVWWCDEAEQYPSNFPVRLRTRYGWLFKRELVDVWRRSHGDAGRVYSPAAPCGKGVVFEAKPRAS